MKKEEAIQKRHEFQKIRDKQKEIYNLFNSGLCSFEKVMKIDEEYKKAYNDFYGLAV